MARLNVNPGRTSRNGSRNVNGGSWTTQSTDFEEELDFSPAPEPEAPEWDGGDLTDFEEQWDDWDDNDGDENVVVSPPSANPVFKPGPTSPMVTGKIDPINVERQRDRQREVFPAWEEAKLVEEQRLAAEAEAAEAKRAAEAKQAAEDERQRIRDEEHANSHQGRMEQMRDGLKKAVNHPDFADLPHNQRREESYSGEAVLVELQELGYTAWEAQTILDEWIHGSEKVDFSVEDRRDRFGNVKFGQGSSFDADMEVVGDSAFGGTGAGISGGGGGRDAGSGSSGGGSGRGTDPWVTTPDSTDRSAELANEIERERLAQDRALSEANLEESRRSSRAMEALSREEHELSRRQFGTTFFLSMVSNPSMLHLLGGSGGLDAFAGILSPEQIEQISGLISGGGSAQTMNIQGFNRLSQADQAAAAFSVTAQTGATDVRRRLVGQAPRGMSSRSQTLRRRTF